MKRPFLSALSAGAVCAILSMTPALAQVSGNSGSLHAKTVHSQQYKGLRGYAALAPDPAKPGCGVTHDFNMSQTHYQYIAVCPLFH
jgi:hypothetical protein